MKTTFRNLLRLGALGLIGATIGLVGCQSSGDRSMGQKWDDREVASSVKKELSSDPTFKYEDVQANVYNGNVQLTGFVNTPEQRQRAGELASHAKGAKQVINGIMLKPTPTGPVPIRDPLGHDNGQVMVDTNAPATPPTRSQPDANAPQQPAPGAPSNGADNNPK
jgi:hyperosmotically inducible periplasmic protein